MNTCADKIAVSERRVTSLMAECEDVEEIVRDAEDRAVGQVEFVFP